MTAGGGTVARSLREKMPQLRPSGAPRTPFVLLVLVLLAVGLVILLLVNTATATGSFRQRSLQDRNDRLALAQQQLQRGVQRLDSPQQLAAAAARLGMVPGGDPAFVQVVGTKVRVIGTPTPATSPPPPPAPPTTARTTPPRTPTAGPSQGTATSPTAPTETPAHASAPAPVSRAAPSPGSGPGVSPR